MMEEKMDIDHKEEVVGNDGGGSSDVLSNVDTVVSTLIVNKEDEDEQKKPSTTESAIMNGIDKPGQKHIQGSKVLPFISAHNLHIFRKDDKHEHIEECRRNCTGYVEEAVIDISQYTPNNSKVPGGVLQISSADTSHDFNYICCSDNQKNVYIFSAPEDSWELFARLQLESRPLLKIQFDNQLKTLVMTDKSGDVYISSIQPNLNNIIGTPQRIVGHCSYITDSILSEHQDQHYILTSDRDHKIRMSNFPDGYNIERYFLAHTEPVQQIALLKNDTVLVSVSEKGTIIIWELIPELNKWKQYDPVNSAESMGYSYKTGTGTGTTSLKSARSNVDPTDDSKIQIALQSTDGTIGIIAVNLKTMVSEDPVVLLPCSANDQLNQLALFDDIFLEYNREKNVVCQLYPSVS